MTHHCFCMLSTLVVLFMSMTMTTASAENWLQLQGDALRSGNSTAELPQTIGLIGFGGIAAEMARLYRMESMHRQSLRMMSSTSSMARVSFGR